MRTIVPPFIQYVANLVSRIPGAKRLLKPLYYSYKEKVNNNRNRIFRLNAISVLRAFDAVMMDNNIAYSVFAGTMLGAVREKGFIKHDLDIDTTVFYSDRPINMIEIMQNAGFRLIKTFTIDDGSKGLEETYEMDNVTIDIFYVHYDDDGHTYQCDFHAYNESTSFDHSMRKYGYVISRKLKMPVSRQVKRIAFESIHVNIMINYDEWLRCRYGDDYMIPNPNFTDRSDNPYIIVWKHASYKSH